MESNEKLIAESCYYEDILTLDVQHDVFTPPLAHPVGGLAHVVAGLPLLDPLEDQTEVGEYDPLGWGV